VELQLNYFLILFSFVFHQSHQIVMQEKQKMAQKHQQEIEAAAKKKAGASSKATSPKAKSPKSSPK